MCVCGWGVRGSVSLQGKDPGVPRLGFWTWSRCPNTRKEPLTPLHAVPSAARGSGGKGAPPRSPLLALGGWCWGLRGEGAGRPLSGGMRAPGPGGRRGPRRGRGGRDSGGGRARGAGARGRDRAPAGPVRAGGAARRRAGPGRRGAGRGRGRGEPPAPRRRSLAPTRSLGRAAQRPPPLRAALAGAGPPPPSVRAAARGRRRGARGQVGPGRAGSAHGPGAGGGPEGARPGPRPCTRAARGALKVTLAASALPGARGPGRLPPLRSPRAGAGGRGLGRAARSAKLFPGWPAAAGCCWSNPWKERAGGVQVLMRVITIATPCCGEPTVCSQPLLTLGGGG